MTHIRSQLYIAAKPADVSFFVHNPTRSRVWISGTSMEVCGNAITSENTFTWHIAPFYLPLARHHHLMFEAVVTLQVIAEGKGTRLVHRVEYTIVPPHQPLSRRSELLIQRAITKNVRLSLFAAQRCIEREYDAHAQHRRLSLYANHMLVTA